MIVVEGERETRYYCHYDAFSNVAALLNIVGKIKENQGHINR